jgi:hypothetical protein
MGIEQASKKKLISIAKSKIDKMSKASVLKHMAKADYEEVFTAATWKSLNKRLDSLSLISIAKSNIDKMSKATVLKHMAKAEYEEAFTELTWKQLNSRLKSFD